MNNPLINSITSSPIVKIVLTIAMFTLLLAILPDTPFMQFLIQLNELPYLNYLNWFVPVGRCLTVMTAWWTCVVVYYGISWILRQLGFVGS